MMCDYRRKSLSLITVIRFPLAASDQRPPEQPREIPVPHSPYFQHLPNQLQSLRFINRNCSELNQTQEPDPPLRPSCSFHYTLPCPISRPSVSGYTFQFSLWMLIFQGPRVMGGSRKPLNAVQCSEVSIYRSTNHVFMKLINSVQSTRVLQASHSTRADPLTERSGWF